MKLFNSSLERLVPSNLAFTEAEVSHKLCFLLKPFLFCVMEKLTAHENVA